ncbi:hypothetical protein COD94_24245 [Bacillus cereus]|nr:hypothetical protein COD94_24245 [Bacillus cereus]
MLKGKVLNNGQKVVLSTDNTYGQTYGIDSILANQYITDGLMIDYDTQLENPKLLNRVNHDVIRFSNSSCEIHILQE